LEAASIVSTLQTLHPLLQVMVLVQGAGIGPGLRAWLRLGSSRRRAMRVA
jgi:hypothetical protein